MARITANLKIRLNSTGTRWALEEELEYRVFHADNTDEVIKVPQDFGTDLASVPAIARVFVSTWEKAARAAVVHDYLVSVPGQTAYGYTKCQADRIFVEVLGVVGHRLRWALWAAVRAWGSLHGNNPPTGHPSSQVTPISASTLFSLFGLGLVLLALGVALGIGSVAAIIDAFGGASSVWMGIVVVILGLIGLLAALALLGAGLTGALAVIKEWRCVEPAPSDD